MKKILAIILLLITLSSKGQTYIYTTTATTGGMNWADPGTISGYMNGITLLASKTGISGASLATTDLTFASGIALSTHTPIFAVIKYTSGTVGISAIRIKTAGGYLIAATALLGLTATDDNYTMQLTGLVRNTGNVSAEITTASLGASAISVYVYGVKKN